MGKYINAVNGRKLPAEAEKKCSLLLANGAKEVDGSTFVQDLVCVVDNFLFGAAGWAYDEREFNMMSEDDGRPKRWFVLPNAHLHIDKD